MITDVHRPRLLPYAAILAPPSKAGNVTRQNALTADIRASQGCRGQVADVEAGSGVALGPLFHPA